MGLETVNYKCGHSAEQQFYGPHSARDSKREWLERGVCPECYRKQKAQEPKTTSRPDGKVEIEAVTVTLPSGKSQEFRVYANSGRVYVGTSYWTVAQFETALAKMVAAGASVAKETTFDYE